MKLRYRTNRDVKIKRRQSWQASSQIIIIVFRRLGIIQNTQMDEIQRRQDEIGRQQRPTLNDKSGGNFAGPMEWK